MKRDWVLKKCNASDVWGIGRRLSAHLAAMNISSAWDLVHKNYVLFAQALLEVEEKRDALRHARAAIESLTVNRPGFSRHLASSLSARHGSNTFYLGLQKVSGDDAWMRVNGTNGGTLANDSYNSSYDNAREKSWQVRHDFNFVVLGAPGLTLMNRYISGENVHTGTITDGKEWGRESELGYTVQSGVMKNLNLRWRNSSIRRDYSTNEFDENRLIITYPLSLL